MYLFQMFLQNIRCTGCKLCAWAFFIVALRSRLRHRIRIRIDPSQQFPADIAAVLVLKRRYKLLNPFIVILLLRCRFRVCIAFQSSRNSSLASSPLDFKQTDPFFSVFSTTFAVFSSVIAIFLSCQTIVTVLPCAFSSRSAYGKPDGKSPILCLFFFQSYDRILMLWQWAIAKR